MKRLWLGPRREGLIEALGQQGLSDVEGGRGHHARPVH